MIAVHGVRRWRRMCREVGVKGPAVRRFDRVAVFSVCTRLCVCDGMRACACICGHVWVCGAENKVAIAAAGGIERVVSAMARHAGSAGVQEYGCDALWDLAVNDGA